MTRHGLIIGTSHSAALRLAWNDGPAHWPAQWPAMTLDFAALHGVVADFQVTGHSLTARNPAARQKLQDFTGQSAFDLDAYDFVALCGGTTSTFHAVNLYNTTRWIGLPSARTSLGPGLSLLSARCFETALTGVIRAAPALPLLQAIKASGTKASLFAIPHPALSHDVLNQTQQHQGFIRLHRNGDAAALTQMLNRASLQAYAGLATYVPPPAVVREDDFFTDARFRRGATRLGNQDNLPQPADDFMHGNADYGRHILSALAALI